MEKGRQCTYFNSLKRVSITALWDRPLFRDLQHKEQVRTALSNKQLRLAEKIGIYSPQPKPRHQVNIKQDLRNVINVSPGEIKIILKFSKCIRNKRTVGDKYLGSAKLRLAGWGQKWIIRELEIEHHRYMPQAVNYQAPLILLTWVLCELFVNFGGTVAQGS